MTAAKGNEVTINGMKIHYRKHGSGKSVVLLIHGAVGSHNDFSLQMDDEGECGLNTEQFTVIAPDLPGYGHSQLHTSDQLKACEPNREYYELCANVCAKLMANLQYKTYSVGGWNDGARVAALLAIQCQSRVNSLLLWGFAPEMDQKSCQAIARSRDTSNWEPSILKFYSDVYGEQHFSELWRHYVDFVVRTLEATRNQEIEPFDLRPELCKIKCPTLVLHGSEDPILSFREHVKPLEMQIFDSEVRQLKGLAHNIHQADPVGFGQIMGQFVASAAA